MKVFKHKKTGCIVYIGNNLVDDLNARCPNHKDGCPLGIELSPFYRKLYNLPRFVVQELIDKAKNKKIIENENV